jgi:hypothetical protein
VARRRDRAGHPTLPARRMTDRGRREGLRQGLRQGLREGLREGPRAPRGGGAAVAYRGDAQRRRGGPTCEIPSRNRCRAPFPVERGGGPMLGTSPRRRYDSREGVSTGSSTGAVDEWPEGVDELWTAGSPRRGGVRGCVRHRRSGGSTTMSILHRLSTPCGRGGSGRSLAVVRGSHDPASGARRSLRVCYPVWRRRGRSAGCRGTHPLPPPPRTTRSTRPPRPITTRDYRT